MKVAVVLLVCLLCATTLAHDWMETPVPHNGGSAQQVSPCDPITNDSPTNNIIQGQPIDVSWANGHHTGQHVLQLAVFGQDTTVDDFKTVATVTADPVAAPQHYSLAASTFSSYSLGQKLTLRYSWQGFDNCATLVVSAAPPAGATTPATSVHTNPVTNKPIVAGDMLLTNSKNQTIGTFNIYNGQLICSPGYSSSNGNCVVGSGSSTSGSGLSGAAQFFIALFVIAVVGVAAIAGFSYYKHGDALHYVRKSTYARTAAPYNAAAYTPANNGSYAPPAPQQV